MFKKLSKELYPLHLWNVYFPDAGVFVLF